MGHLDEHIAVAVRAHVQILVVADPGHPAAGLPVIGLGIVEAVEDVAHGDDQLARRGIVFRLVSFAGEFGGEGLRLAPRFALVGGEGHEGEGVLGIHAEDRGEFAGVLAVVGRAEHFGFAESVAADVENGDIVLFVFTPFAVLSEQTHGLGPFHLSFFVEGEIGLVDGEIPVVVIEPHPLVDVVAVFVAHLRKTAHRDDGVELIRAGKTVILGTGGVGAVEILHIRPFKPVAAAVGIERSGDCRVPSFAEVAFRGPAGTARYDDELLGAVGEVEFVDGGSFLGFGKGSRDGNGFVCQPLIVADAHESAAGAVSEREHRDDVAVVEQDTVGVGEVTSAGDLLVADHDLVVEVVVFRRNTRRLVGKIDYGIRRGSGIRIVGAAGVVCAGISRVRGGIRIARDHGDGGGRSAPRSFSVAVAARKRERQREHQDQYKRQKLLFHIRLLEWRII